MVDKPRKIFIGGYTKSGTTFIGRAFGIFNGVYAKGELDYFRIFCNGLHDLFAEYNKNIQIVNKEVYDGRGSLKPVTVDSMALLHDKIFNHVFFAGEPVPEDCRVIVEKSPRNIFWLKEINRMFPEAQVVCVYRDSKAVFRSLMRHMADHRNPQFRNADFKPRADMLASFCLRWARFLEIIDANRSKISLVRYQPAADDNQAFVDFIASDILKYDPGLRAPVETLSKEYYLNSLPEDVRATSLVQTATHKIELSDQEKEILDTKCPAPVTHFDF